MGFTSANSCCCFDLRTGGLILGYFSIINAIFYFFGVNKLLSVFIVALIVTWLYGIHANKRFFLLPNLIWTFIETTIVCISFTVVTFGALFGLEVINWIYEKGTSAASINFGYEHGMQAKVYSPEVMSGFDTGKTLAGGIIFIMWLICAIITACFWYITVVMCSLYKLMTEESFRQQQEQPPYAQCRDFEVGQITK